MSSAPLLTQGLGTFSTVYKLVTLGMVRGPYSRTGSGEASAVGAAAGAGTRQEVFLGTSEIVVSGGALSGTGTRQAVFSATGTLYAVASLAGTGAMGRRGSGQILMAAASVAGLGIATDVQGVIVVGGFLLTGTGTFTPWQEREYTRRVPTQSEYALPRKRAIVESVGVRRASPWPRRRDSYPVD